jgi:hypothetical protein
MTFFHASRRLGLVVTPAPAPRSIIVPICIWNDDECVAGCSKPGSSDFRHSDIFCVDGKGRWDGQPGEVRAERPLGVGSYWHKERVAACDFRLIFQKDCIRLTFSKTGSKFLVKIIPDVT